MTNLGSGYTTVPLSPDYLLGLFNLRGNIIPVVDLRSIFKLERAEPDDVEGMAVFETRKVAILEFDNLCLGLLFDSTGIVNIGQIENTVLAASLCLGAIDLRGNTVPVVNFSLLLGYSDASIHDIQESDSNRVIIMKIDDNLFGLLVSQINNIVSYFDDELTAFPVLGYQKTAMFKGYIAGATSTQGTIVLEQREILSNDEIHTITKGHSALFKDAKDPSFTKKHGSLNRKTLITFYFGNLYGLEMGEVKEVIDYPAKFNKDAHNGQANSRHG